MNNSIIALYGDFNGYAISIIEYNKLTEEILIEMIINNSKVSYDSILTDINKVFADFKNLSNVIIINEVESLKNHLKKNFKKKIYSFNLEVESNIFNFQCLLNDEKVKVNSNSEKLLINSLEIFELEKVNHVLYSLFLGIAYIDIVKNVFNPSFSVGSYHYS